jgi:hypothetical protein
LKEGFVEKKVRFGRWVEVAEEEGGGGKLLK